MRRRSKGCKTPVALALPLFSFLLSPPRRPLATNDGAKRAAVLSGQAAVRRVSACGACCG